MVSPGTDNAAISAGTWEAAMEDGQVALISRDFTAAYRHFGGAHGLGHNQLASHLAAHAGLLATARSQHKAGKIAVRGMSSASARALSLPCRGSAVGVAAQDALSA
jgi:Protein of unknown function (DUF3703)